jgi:hypothetical protein
MKAGSTISRGSLSWGYLTDRKTFSTRLPALGYTRLHAARDLAAAKAEHYPSQIA